MGRRAAKSQARDCDTRAIDVRRWQREGLLKSQHFGWQWTDSDTGEVLLKHQRLSAGAWAVNQLCNQRPAIPTVHRDDNHAMPLWRLAGLVPLAQGVAHVAQGFCAGAVPLPRLQQITYRSQREDQIGRLWLAQAKIEARLGQDLTRPKFMRLATFERLRSRFWQLEHEREMVFSDWAERFREWL